MAALALGIASTSQPVGRREEEREGAQSFSLSYTHHFCLYPFGKNLVTWSQVTTGEVGIIVLHRQPCAHLKFRDSISKIKKGRMDIKRQ